MTIPRRYRQTNSAWGVGLVIGVPIVLFGLAWSAAWVPRWVGLSPSDAELRVMIEEEGARLVARIDTFMAEHGRVPGSLGELDIEASHWKLIDGKSGLVLVRHVSPDEVLEYVFSSQSVAQVGWYRRNETGPREPLKIEPGQTFAQELP
jgi:hypothetical protein